MVFIQIPVHPGRVVIHGESAGVAFYALYDEMYLSVGVIGMPWLILYLVYILAVTSFYERATNT